MAMVKTQKWIVCLVLICLSRLQFCTALAEQEQLSKSKPHCPQRCSCSSRLKRVSCIGLNLRSIPHDIPLSVTELYLSHNLLTGIPKGIFFNLTNMSILSLEYNLIEKVDNGAFMGLNNLNTLYLRSNKLSWLSMDAFQGLESLRYLYFTQNHLVNIPDIGYARNLIYLTLDNNALTSAHIPDGFRNLTRLSTLVLSNNPNLKQITADDFAALNHSTVRKLDVSRCSLTDIGDGVFNFPRLQSLVLSYNLGWNGTFLRTVLASVSNCSELTSLDMSGVISLETLPADIFVNLSGVPLKHLNLAHTSKVATIHNGTFQYFPTLEQLDLSKSEFVIIKDTMSSMKKLSTLTLSHNKQLKAISNLDAPALQALDISFCDSITELKPNTFLNLPKLSTLSVQHCRIRTIYKDVFSGLDQLKKLDLSYNNIGGSSLPVDAFSPLVSLVELDLSYNNLATIATEKDLFQKLKVLRTLDMSGNKCSMIPEEIFSPLTSLTSLDLSHNCLGDRVISGDSGGKLLHGLGALETVMLMFNDLHDLPAGLFDSLLSLKMVNVTHNDLSAWNGSAFASSTNLSLIDFSVNRITTVPEQSIVSLASKVKLNLSNNPFACWCDLIWFRKWITNDNVTETKLPGLDSYKCSSPATMLNKPILDFDPEAIAQSCSPPPWIIITVGSASGVAMIIIFFVALYYKYRWPIRLKMYKLRKRMRHEPGYDRMDEAPEDDYDVFVSYGPSTADEKWVSETLMPVIDAKERARRFPPQLMGENGHDENAAAADVPAFLGVAAYWEKRDMLPGTSEIGAIAEAIHASRKIILIVSSEYLKDGRRVFEVEIAVEKSCRAHRLLEDIGIVLLDKNAAVRLPPVLHSKIEGALEWTPDNPHGQELFWRQLQDFLQTDVPLLDV